MVFVSFQINTVDLGVVVGQSRRPIKIGHFEERSLHAAHETELVAVDEMVAAFDSFQRCVWIKGAGLKAVEAKELVFLGVEIGHVEEELGVFYNKWHVAVKAEHP